MYRILLVEDDRALRYIYARMHVWQENDFILAAQAEHGKQALELLEQENFDLILTDIRMPFVDGLELLNQLRQKGCTTPVILISSYNEFEYARKGLVLGAFDYIVKPVEEKQLSAVLQRAAALLAQNRQQDSGFQIVQAALEQVGISMENDRFVHTLCTFLAGQMQRVITMEEAAEHMGLSKDYFGKECKAHTGMSFGTLYSLIKMEHAKLLLRESSEKTYEISEKLGYASPNYFTRVFKEQTGQTPSQYRAQFNR